MIRSFLRALPIGLALCISLGFAQSDAPDAAVTPTLDERINEIVQPITNAVEDVVFFSFKLKDDVLYSVEGNRQPAEAFYEHPPFFVTYETDNNQVDYGQVFRVIYREGQYTIAPVSEVNGEDVIGTAVTATPNLPTEVGGFQFQLEPNPDSALPIEGQAFRFQVREVSFLPLVIAVLLFGAFFFTIYFRFVNIRHLGTAFGIVRGKYSDPDESGEVSHFQALTAALSGTVGLGNIAGVAVAISLGGAGATFWMILAGFFGMSTKFVECTLGVKYRQIDENGEVSGGPMYYLRDGLAKLNKAGLGKFLAAFFAITCIGGSFGGGNMVQVNQAFAQFASLDFVQGTWFATSGWFFGLVMAGLVAIVIIGGIKSIARVTDKIVPIMCGIYLLAGFIILGLNFSEIPRAISDIVVGAFSPLAVAGGFIGVIIQGFRRAAFSNEAGVGSASIAHSAVRTNYPASEGLVSLLEPLVDTVIVCTVTALVIVITNNHLDVAGISGVTLTSTAFSSELPFFKYVLAIAVILFAFSTMISWSYYGLKSFTFLFGDSRTTDLVYKVMFLSFVVLGAAMSLDAVFAFGDAMIFAMVFPNVIGLFFLMPEVREELSRYLIYLRERFGARVGDS